MKQFFTCLFLCLSFLSFAQQFNWGFEVGGIGTPNSLGIIDEYFRDEGRAITRDNNGNIYVTGIFEGSADFNPDTSQVNTVSTAGSKSLFVAKYNSNGAYQWAFEVSGFNISNSREALGHDIAVDNAGNVYITGTFSGGFMDFNPDPFINSNLNSNGGYDIFVAKYTTDGDYLWAHNFGGTADDSGEKIEVDGNGNIYLTGNFEGNLVDFNPGFGQRFLNSNGDVDMFTAKYDTNGDLIWVFGVGGSSFDIGSGIAVDGIGNVYLTGSFSGSNVDFNPDNDVNNRLNSNSGEDIFVAKYDANGNYLWAFNIGSVSQDNGFGLVIDGLSNIYITGRFRGSNVDFDPSSATNTLSDNGAFDIFVAKYSTNGDYIWAFNIGSADYDAAFDIAIDNWWHVYITGYFQGTNIDFDPSSEVNALSSNGSTDIFVARYNRDGGYEWAFNVGGPNADLGYGVVAAESNKPFITGTFSGLGIDFDSFTPDDTTSLGTDVVGNFNFYVASYKRSPLVSSENINNDNPVKIFPNPVNDYLNIENGQGQMTIFNMLGQNVYQEKVTQSLETVNLSQLPKGQYIMSIQRENGSRISQLFLK